MASLKGKTAIVTGSTSGIGEAIAKCLAAEGVNIVINGFGDAKEIETLRDAIEKQYKVKVTYSGADVTKTDQVEKMIDDAGQVDILVNNAGIQFVAPIEEFPNEKWDAVIATNLSSVFHSIKHAFPGMKKRGSGRIINIASAHGLVASPNKSAYVAAKHGVVGLTKVVAIEAGESGVTCNAICPGWVMTPLVEKQIADKAKANGTTIKEETLKLVAEKQPNKRFTTPEEIGALVIYLCSDAAQGITGAAISIDGGWVAE